MILQQHQQQQQQQQHQQQQQQQPLQHLPVDQMQVGDSIQLQHMPAGDPGVLPVMELSHCPPGPPMLTHLPQQQMAQGYEQPLYPGPNGLTALPPELQHGNGPEYVLLSGPLVHPMAIHHQSSQFGPNIGNNIPPSNIIPHNLQVNVSLHSQ